MRTLFLSLVLSSIAALPAAAACPTAGPSLIEPAGPASVAPGSLTFRWNAVQGATDYEIFIGLAGDTPESHGRTDGQTSATFTIEPGYDVAWYVFAYVPNCTGVRSDTVFFRTACDDTRPTLLAPDRGAQIAEGEPVTFEWTAVTWATGYDVIVTPDHGESFQMLVEGLTSTSYVTTLPPGDWGWTVRANLNGTCDGHADPSFFLVGSSGGDDCPANPGTATLVSPAAGATNLTSPVTFEWSAVPEALGYRVIGAFGDGAPVTLGLTTSTSLTATLAEGSGYWQVETYFGDRCPTTFSERRLLSVSSGTACSDTAPAIVSPANGATGIDSPVTFQWTSVPNANGYALFVAIGDDEFEFYGATEETSLERRVPAGTIRWFVVANFATCPSVRSAIATFEVSAGAECAPASIVLGTPSNGAEVNSPVALSWSAVAGAEAYRVWGAAGGSAPAILARTTSTEASVSLPAGTIVWYVEALRPGCPAVVSPKGEFTVLQRAGCDENQAPSLVSPAGPQSSPAVATDPVTLVWTPAHGAAAYRVWMSSDGQPFSDVKITTATELQLELPPGVYGWFVQALYEGCAPKASPVGFFRIDATSPRCTIARPAIVAPANDSSASAPVTFIWTAVEGAAKYRVFASVDASEPQLLGVTFETQLTRALPPGSVIWTVEAVFDNCPSTFSPRSRFTIPESQSCSGANAEPVAPANGASSLPASVDFAWSAVSGAIRYVVVARANGGAPTPIATTADTNVTRTLPPGQVEWWVVTFFSACKPTESEHFGFGVARPAGCENRKPILLHPSTGAGEIAPPVHFAWTAVPRATGYRVWAWEGDDDPTIVAATTDPKATVGLAAGTYQWYVEALFENCPATESARAEFTAGGPVPCGTPRKPVAQVVGQALSGTEYRLRWTPLPNVALYSVQESTTPDFSNAQTFTTSDVSMKFSHEVTGAPVQYLYRVRGISDCNDEQGPYSNVVGVFVIAPRTSNASAEIGTAGTVVQTIALPGSDAPLTFTANADKPWLAVTPSSGVLPPDGTTLTVTADPTVLALGTNTGTITLDYTSPANGVRSNATTKSKVPLSVSLVTPVVPAGQGTPPPDSLIFPGVGHAVGVNDSLFESDVRVTNLSAQTMKYQLNFTPSGSDGTQTGSSSTIEIAPNATIAFDDIVASLFGSGTTSSATGMLEVRPLTTSTSSSSAFFTSLTQSAIKELTTAASSRTYNFTPNGTFGQFVPAIRFADFVGKATEDAAATILSLQQVAQSSAYRANFGFVEASGQSADLMVRVYDTASRLLATFPVSLKPREHMQINGMLGLNGINDLADGRVEVEVVGGAGKVTAYVSSVDNRTNDPLLVWSAVKGGISADRYVMPGAAFLDNGFAFWVTDLRIFNAGSTSTPATLTFYPQGNPSAAVTRDLTLAAGEIAVLDNVVGSLFGQPNGSGGMIAITTPQKTTLTTTARTYNQTSNGTYGQYVPGVTVAESVGAADRPLQILQLEQSSRFRTNIGLAETSGQPAMVDVSLILPDSLVTPVVSFSLVANEFRQFSLADFNLGDAIYNARVTVKVTGGNGRVTAYGSVIDAQTQDPTYVPAQ